MTDQPAATVSPSGRPRGREMAPGVDIRLIVVGPRALDFLPLLRAGLVPAHVVVREAGDAAGSFRARGAAIRGAEAGVRRPWGSGSVDELLPALAGALSVTSSEPLILPYMATPRLRAAVMARRPRATVLGPRADLVQLLQDRARSRAALRRAGLPVPRSITVVPPAAPSFDNAARRLGCPFVAQTLSGSSGIGTWAVADRDAWDRLLRARGWQRLLLSSWCGRTVINTHVLLGGDRPVVSAPSIQLAGVAQLGALWPIYCGNDFGAARRMPEPVRRRCRAVVDRAAAWLGSLGYAGLAGIDLVLDDYGSPRLLEVNPRCQGSTWLLGEVEWARGETPLLARLLANDAQQGPDVPMSGAAQLLVRAPGGRFDPVTTAVLRPGCYRLDKGVLEYVRPAVGLQTTEPGDVVISGVPPPSVHRACPAAVVARLATQDQVVDVDGHTLTSRGRELAQALGRLVRVRRDPGDDPS